VSGSEKKQKLIQLKKQLQTETPSVKRSPEEAIRLSREMDTLFPHFLRNECCILKVPYSN